MGVSGWCAISVSLFTFSGVQGAPVEVQAVKSGTFDTFEVVSVKRSPPGMLHRGFGGGRRIQSDPSMLRMRTASIEEMIMYAYSLPSYDQLSGIPDGFHAYDIDAVTGRPSTNEEERRMLQRVLAERFRLTVHWERREGRTYALSAAEKPQLKQVTGEAGPPPRMATGEGGSVSWMIRGSSMADFSAWLAGMVGGPVADKTALPARYDFDLQVVQEGAGALARTQDFAGALREVGLRLLQSRGAVAILVVDNVEEASGN